MWLCMSCLVGGWRLSCHDPLQWGHLQIVSCHDPFGWEAGPIINNLIKISDVLLWIIAFLLWIMSGHPSILNNFGYACHDTFAVEACVHHDMRGWRLLSYHIILYYMLLYVIKIYFNYSYYISYIYIYIVIRILNKLDYACHDPSGVAWSLGEEAGTYHVIIALGGCCHLSLILLLKSLMFYYTSLFFYYG